MFFQAFVKEGPPESSVTSTEISNLVKINCRDVVVIMDQVFPNHRRAILRGNKSSDLPTKVRYDGLRIATPSDLASDLRIVVICGTTVEVKHGVLPALVGTRDLECDNDCIASVRVNAKYCLILILSTSNLLGQSWRQQERQQSSCRSSIGFPRKL